MTMSSKHTKTLMIIFMQNVSLVAQKIKICHQSQQTIIIKIKQMNIKTEL